jgi:hypothetical protein
MDGQPGHLPRGSPTHLRQHGTFCFFFTKCLHKVQTFREKDGLSRPAGGEIPFRVRDCVTRVIY